MSFASSKVSHRSKSNIEVLSPEREPLFMRNTSVKGISNLFIELSNR